MISLSFKGQKADIKLALSDSATMVFMLAAEAFADCNLPADMSLAKVVHKGKKLQPALALEAQGVKAGSKLMLIASSSTAVGQVINSVSDPTIRGFESERALEKARRAPFEKGGGSAWKSEQDREFKFSKLEVVAFPASVKPHPFEAEKLLTKLATDPGIVTCMREHRWSVGKLVELDPADDQKKHDGSGATTLGYNENAGFRIYVRLRTDDLRALRPYRELVNTLLHELSHNSFGPHTEPFWRLFALQKRRYLRTHAQLQAQGNLIRGATASSLADLAESGEAQDISGALRGELGRSSGNNALQPHEREAAARVVMEYEALALLEAHSRAALGPSPQAAAGAAAGARGAMTSREAAALAAESRASHHDPVAAVAAVAAKWERSAPTVITAVPPGVGEGLAVVPAPAPAPAAAMSAASSDNAPTPFLPPPLAPGSPPEMKECAGAVLPERILTVEEEDRRVRKACTALLERQEEESGRRRPVSGHSAEGDGGGMAETVATLLAIMGNVLRSPGEEKFRRLKLKSNKRLKRTVLAEESAVELLAAVGFRVVQRPRENESAPVDDSGVGNDLELPFGTDLAFLSLTQQLLGQATESFMH